MDDPVMDAQSKAYLSAVDALAESLAAYWAKEDADFAAWSAAAIAAGGWPIVPGFAGTYEINAEDCISINSGAGFHATSDTIAALAVPQPITPFGPITPMPPPGRFVKFGGLEICTRCQYAREFCGCAKQAAADAPPKDGADSSLERRARECMEGK